MPRRTTAREDIDFGDEDAVLAEVARALEMDPEELRIRRSHLSDFGAGDVYEVASGRMEWNVVESDDAERELAIAVVTQDLESEPEIFEPHFIESHIDKDRLRRELHSDILSMREEDLREMRDREFWREWESEGWELPEEDEDGELPEPDDSQIEELAERQTEEQLRDPLAYLEDIYGDEAAKKAIEIAGIDIEAAAEEAVDTDGPAHFLAHYDGNSQTTRGGLVYWRVN
jgi:hypothetical protein